ncbi:hypothetical protein K469DRAFT_707148 [Zopfia rhizophila CBS 207.26]|uniref:Uncharacterized protein n=1 Tax=Zopfia rhizophila CBS 207.26 TaxID=1314779 RepID=A0A6A6E483_9PEZI|nr:hypothetical protein K469DRAFT_707148 [Zopfia rhizophila CBS 207.26]
MCSLANPIHGSTPARPKARHMKHRRSPSAPGLPALRCMTQLDSNTNPEPFPGPVFISPPRTPQHLDP